MVLGHLFRAFTPTTARRAHRCYILVPVAVWLGASRMAPPPVELSFVKASPASITFELHGRGAERSALHRHASGDLCEREASPEAYSAG